MILSLIYLFPLDHKIYFGYSLLTKYTPVRYIYDCFHLFSALKTTAKPKVRHTSPHHTVRINAKKQLVKKYLVKIRIPEGLIITSNAFTKALIPLQTEPTSMASDNMKFAFKEHYDSKFEEHSVNQHEEDFDNRFEEYNYNR